MNKVSILYLFACLSAFTLAAQPNSISRIHVKTPLMTTDTATVSSSFGGDSLIVTETKTLAFEVADTSNISTIQIRLGSSLNGSDFYDQSFSFNSLSIISSIIWFKRKGIICSAGIGNWVNRRDCFLSIDAKNAAGTIVAHYSGKAY